MYTPKKKVTKMALLKKICFASKKNSYIHPVWFASDRNVWWNGIELPNAKSQVEPAYETMVDSVQKNESMMDAEMQKGASDPSSSFIFIKVTIKVKVSKQIWKKNTHVHIDVCYIYVKFDDDTHYSES